MFTFKSSRATERVKPGSAQSAPRPSRSALARLRARAARAEVNDRADFTARDLVAQSAYWRARERRATPDRGDK